MRRDPHSKAIVFPPDPNKKINREQRRKVVHHSDEIQFLADCINYQQEIIEKQKSTIEEHEVLIKTLSVESKTKETKTSKTPK